MEGLRRGKGIYLLVGIIVTFGFLVSGNVARAQGDNLFFTATLLKGQNTGDQTVSSTEPFGLASIAVTSIGNKTAAADLTVRSKQSGLWSVFIFGTGGRTWADVAVGVSPFAGPDATIDIGEGVSFVYALGYVIILDALNPISDENPLSFSMKITGG